MKMNMLPSVKHFTKKMDVCPLIFLFVLLVVISYLSPRLFIQQIFDSAWGRFFIVLFIIFFAHQNFILGILTVLFVIYMKHRSKEFYVIEGMTDADVEAKKDEAKANLTPEQQEALDAKKKEMKDKKDAVAAKAEGVDKEAIRQSLQAKSSNQLPVPSSQSSDDVSPNVEEGFSNRNYHFLKQHMSH